MPRLLDLRPNERRATAWAALCYGCVLFAWFLIRPLREAFGIARGADDLPYLMMGTFVVATAVNPLYARLVDRMPRERAVQFVYRFVQGNLLLFWAAFLVFGDPNGGASDGRLWLGYGMYVWMSTVNLTMVSVFWSLCNESLPVAGTRRTFGPAAAGGTVGALLGATCAKELSGVLDEPLHVLLLSVLLLEGAIVAVRGILRNAPVRPVAVAIDEDAATTRPAFRGSPFAGFRDLVRSPFVLLILAYVGFHAVSGTWAYLIQGEIVERTEGDHAQRVRMFASIDQLTQGLTLFLQLFVVTRLVGERGMGRTLAVLPLVSAASFVAIFVSPTFAVLHVCQALRRASNYGLSKPSREMLFAVLTPEQKYKLKNLVDVAGYRFFDWIGALSRIGLRGLGVATGMLCLVSAGLSALWIVAAAVLGASYVRLAAAAGERETEVG